jgi:DNA-binding IclR family transcriptional regulator
MNKPVPGDDSHSTLLRGVRVLFGLVEAGRPMTVTRLAQALDLPASTTHRILNVLRQAGYVSQDADTGTYSPGIAFFRASALLAGAGAFPTVLEATLADLVERSGESAFYAAYLGETQRLRFVKTLHSHHAIQYVLRGDQTWSLLWGATGRSIASRLPVAVVRAIYEREGDSGEGVATLPAWEGLLADLQDIREKGHAVSHGQRHEGSCAVASPVVDRDGAPIGCIGVAMPSSRQQPDKTQQCVLLVTAAAARLNQLAGVAPPLSS